jgi:hypothetical protein
VIIAKRSAARFQSSTSSSSSTVKEREREEGEQMWAKRTIQSNLRGILAANVVGDRMIHAGAMLLNIGEISSLLLLGNAFLGLVPHAHQGVSCFGKSWEAV